ncbi:MAG: hypothetical protein H0W02_14735 [Ktedonobacteraceae bacterium]|nr:hypothetical protein [Ktedonobacteraceae bacterium]
MDRKDDLSEAEIDRNDDEYSIMEQLEILETLREDMEDLGFTTLAEVIQRIEVLHRQLDSKAKA